jgi:hypothetical protein
MPSMKTILFRMGDSIISGQLGARVEKKALYGYSRKVAEKDGVILERGMLSPDGRLLRRSQASLVKLDPEGSPVEDVVSEIDGKPAELLPSSFDRESDLIPSSLARLATFAVTDVYPIDGLTLSEGVYETSFSYRKSIQAKEALLLVKDNGEAYLLSGVSKQAPFLGVDVAYSFFDDGSSDDSDDAEDLDFSMV